MAAASGRQAAPREYARASCDGPPLGRGERSMDRRIGPGPALKARKRNDVDGSPDSPLASSLIVRAAARNPVKLFRSLEAAKQYGRTDEAFFLSRESTRKQATDISTPRSTNEGLVMWWGLIIGLVFTYPAIEMVEEWRIHRSAEKDLVEMRRHTASGDKWDVVRGRWVA